MALVPYTITAIERDVADAAASGKQVVSGAVCSLFLQPSDVVVQLYDNAAGDNGSTSKVTNSSGQVTVWVEGGDYRVSVNGNDSFISLQTGGETVTASVTETQTLAAAQTTVTLASLSTTNTAFYINGPSVDNGRLVLGVDFTLTSTATIELTTAYADGTLITAVQNDGTEALFTAVKVFDSVDSMKLASGLVVDDYVICKRYYSGGELVEGLEYNIVSTATIDGFINHAVVGGFAILSQTGKLNIKQVGGISDGATDITPIINAISPILGSNQIDFPYSAGGYAINTPVTINDLTCVFNGENQLAGTATLQDVNGINVLNGAYQGYVFSPEVRGKQIEIISGTIRAQQYQTALSFTSVGTVGTIVQTAHGYSVDDYIYTRGADDFKWVGTFQITNVVDADTYEVVVDSAGPTVAGGTILVLKPGLWEWIKDAGHEPLGVDDSVPVETDPTGIGLRISMLKNYSKVLSMVVSPDEQIASAQNMSIGASVSLNGLDLRASVDRTIASRIFYDGANWVKNEGTDQAGIFDEIITYSAGNLTVPHGFCKGRAIAVTPDSASGTVANPFLPLMKLPSDDNFILNFMDVTDGSFYTGALSTRMSFTVTKNYCGLIFFDGRDGSGSIGMQFGNIWFFGIMEV